MGLPIQLIFNIYHVLLVVLNPPSSKLEALYLVYKIVIKILALTFLDQ